MKQPCRWCRELRDICPRCQDLAEQRAEARSGR